MYKLNKKKQI